MTLITHIVYALAYVVAGCAIGWALPHVRPEMDPWVGYLSGALMIVTGGLIHEVMTRTERERRLVKRFGHVLEATSALKDEVAHERAELDRFGRQFDEMRQASGFLGYDSVMNEVRLLQSLVGRLQEKRGAPAAAEAPAKAAALRPAARVHAMTSGGPVMAGPTPSTRVVDDDGPPLNDATVLERVREALKADRIDIYLQPIVSLPQRKHRFYEVFSRVRAADGSQIKPDRYVPVAEREGLIATIDNLLLMRCVQLIRETERRQHHIAFFSNISPATLGDGEFMTQFLRLMQENQALVGKLVFELAQDDLRVGEAATHAILSQLARAGFRFSMDQVTDFEVVDVDTLVRNDFRYLKLDCGRALDRSNRPFTEKLLRRCKEHEIDIIVEKVETENQLLEVLDLGIDFGQGYLFGEPRLSRKPG